MDWSPGLELKYQASSLETLKMPSTSLTFRPLNKSVGSGCDDLARAFRGDRRVSIDKSC